MMCTFLTGCWDQRELHHVLYINSLGIDFKDNNYIIRPQFINFSNIAKQEGALPVIIARPILEREKALF